ncbi:MAG: hypothetical protein WBR11_07120 [Terriglobales bacterium]
MNPSFLHFIALNRLVLEGCSAAGLGLAFCFFGVRLLASRYFRGHRSRLRISAASPGAAAIFGRATGPRTLAAPITGSPCYVYRTSIWQQEPGGKSEWKKAAEETGCLTFLLEDSTGQLLVEPLGAELDLRQNFGEEYGSAASSANQPSHQPATQNPIPERLASFLARHGVTVDRPTRIEECCLEPATPVFITGTLTSDTDRSLQTNQSARDANTRDKDASIQNAPANSSSAANASSPRGDTDLVLASSSKPEVIRLTSGSAPSSTLQMTQQAKIAAALNRAGIAQADLWASTDAASPGTQREAATNSRAIFAAPPTTDSASTPASSPNNGNSRSERPESEPAKVDYSQPTPTSASPTGSTPIPRPSLTMTKGSNDAPFLISNQSGLPTSLGWTSVLLVMMGTGLTAFGLQVLLLEYLTRTR